ncbi:MAG TPA: hypothetical protein VNZ94_11365 [Xanthobacteraceae bacterium]|nr:hypothetical protein [Xanthobacteraceae bacterium]
MPELVRLLTRHALIGIALAVLFVGVLLTFDVGGLRTLATASSSGLLAIIALAAACSLTFASVQMGFAIMLLGTEGPGENGNGRRIPTLKTTAFARSAVRSRK